ncbi:MAG: hypothetical protein A2Z92_05465 [Omnitrophica WOR_2 bacterium GWA2_63_20]|nr:MAG: hypothetical protein A2Z92_05465 [Omnitrophica WOR_2 bacterium GWA2_63_20]
MRNWLSALGLLGVWVSVAASLVGFVRPWASMELAHRKMPGALSEAARDTPLQDLLGSLSKRVGKIVVSVKRGAETVTGELPDLSSIPTVISGADIPRLGRRQDAQVVLALAEMWTGQRELGAKSLLVYLVPGLVVLCGVIVTALRRVRAVCAAVGGLSVAVAGAAWWKLSATHLETLVVAITIEQGLWMTCWAYAGLGVSSLALAAVDARSSTRL